MKKLFVAVLAIAGLVACNNEETVLVKGNAPIAFDSFVENATRANVANDPSTTTTSLNAFDVWGFMDQPAGIVFVDEDVTGEQGNFSYQNTQYWVPGHTYYFAALAPMNSANWDLNTANANTYGAGVVSFENKKGTEDLLYAATSVVSAADMAPVKFQFNHLLSKVKFSFINGFVNEYNTIVVKNITMEAPAKGSIDLAVENWWDNDDWNLENEKVILAFGDAGTMGINAKQESAYERFSIPADAAYEYTVKFDVELYMGTVLADTYNKEVKVSGVALEMGKAYNFSAIINASNLELDEIVFDVQEVKEWVDAGEQTVALGGPVTNLTLVSNAVANETVNLAGMLDGAGHTLDAVAGVDYVVSNTARLIEATAPSTIKNLVIDGNDVVYNDYGIRGIYTIGTGDVVVENVEIYKCTYSINANNAGKLTVKNSTLQGWNSYGSTTENYFENVKFIDGTHHNFRPYNNTVVKNCDFGAGVVIDLSYLKAEATIVFEGCTCNGRPLTPADLTAADGKNVKINLVVTEQPAGQGGLVQPEGSADIENVTIDGGHFFTRGIFITKGGEYNVKNVEIKNVTYAISVSTTAAVTLNVEGSVLEGWTSYGNTTTASFKNVAFECGDYANFKPYTSTTLENCSFEDGFMIDFTEITDGEKLTFKNCTYNGVTLTAENFTTAVKVIDGDCTGKIAF